MTTPLEHVMVMFDGLCEPVNPGGIGCFGYSIHGLDGPLDVVRGSGALADLRDGPMTNNYAEYAALGKALAYLVTNAKNRFTPETVLTIVGDSQLVVNQLNGTWACNAENLKPLLSACAEKLAILKCKHTAQWVPREQNVEADALSVAAYVGRTGKPVPVRAKQET
jgi:ribonuclease HI